MQTLTVFFTINSHLLVLISVKVQTDNNLYFICFQGFRTNKFQAVIMDSLGNETNNLKVSKCVNSNQNHTMQNFYIKHDLNFILST